MAETYVGVSGIASQRQQRFTERSFGTYAFNHQRELLLGVKATTKTQLDELEPTKGRAWFPVGDELSTALYFSDCSVKVLQFYADDWTNLEHRALPLIETSLERAADWVDGIQYDLLPWVTEDSSLQIIQRYGHGVAGDGPVILQCHGSIMAENSMASVVERLKRVEGYITHVLFDASEGRGEPMNSDALSYWVEAIQSSDLDIDVAIAGGLGPYRNPHLLARLLQRFDPISWDAESRLHTDNELDPYKVSSYIDLSMLAVKMASKKDE